MFNDLSSPAALLATRRSGKPRDMVAPGPDDAQLRRILACGRAHARSWQACAVALRRSCPPRHATRCRSAAARGLLAEKPAAGTASSWRRTNSSRDQAPTLVVVALRARHASTNPDLGAGIVVRRRRHEPAARHPCDGFRRRLDYRLGGLFRNGPRRVLRRPASGSLASSSSARPDASWRNGRARRCRDGRAFAGNRRTKLPLELRLPPRCIRTA